MPAASWLSQAKSCLHFCKRWKTDIGICHFSCNLIGKKSLNSVASVVCTEVYSCTAEIWSGSKRCVSGLDTSVLLFSWKDGGKGERWNWTGGYHKVKSIAPGPAILFPLADVFKGWSHFWRLCLNKLPTVAQALGKKYHDSLAWTDAMRREFVSLKFLAVNKIT